MIPPRALLIVSPETTIRAALEGLAERASTRCRSWMAACSRAS